MRLDKFLKVSRLIKRRTIASAMCQAGRISINTKTAKASSEVKVGDTLTIEFGNRCKTVEILDVPTKILPRHNSSEGASSLYTVLVELYNDNEGSSEFNEFEEDPSTTPTAEKTSSPNSSGQLDDLFSVLLGEDP